VAPALRESIAITDDSPTVKSVEIVCQVNPKLNGRQRFAQVLARRGLLPPELAGGPDSWQFATEELRAPGENPAAGPKSHAAFAVELEATRAEIERVIADLRARPEEFISVTVPPEFAAPTKATAGQSPVDLFRARFVVRPAAAAAAHGAPSHP